MERNSNSPLGTFEAVSDRKIKSIEISVEKVRKESFLSLSLSHTMKYNKVTHQEAGTRSTVVVIVHFLRAGPSTSSLSNPDRQARHGPSHDVLFLCRTSRGRALPKPCPALRACTSPGPALMACTSPGHALPRAVPTPRPALLRACISPDRAFRKPFPLQDVLFLRRTSRSRAFSRPCFPSFMPSPGRALPRACLL